MLKRAPRRPKRALRGAGNRGSKRGRQEGPKKTQEKPKKAPRWYVRPKRGSRKALCGPILTIELHLRWDDA